MTKSMFLGAALALVLASATPQAAKAEEMTDGEKALAAILAIGVGVAIAKHGKDRDHTSSWDEDRYGQPFSPSAHVVCLPTPRQCYDRGHLSKRWTRRIFGA